jgi:ribose transport system permease protein
MNAKFGMPAFIATLGMMWIARGIAFALAELSITVEWKSATHAGPLLFQGLGDASFLVLAALTVLAAAGMAFTRWGRYVYAIGGNEEASRFSGVPVERMKIGIYALAGLISALAGAGIALKYGSANSGTAYGYELRIIAAVVVGGVSLSGGQGSVVGAVLGALVLRLLEELLIVYNVQEQYIQVVFGVAIVLAVGLDQLLRKGWFIQRRRMA